MRILLENVNTKVAALLAEVKEGVETARAAGLIVELPEKMDFTMEVVTAAQSLTSTTTNSGSKSSLDPGRTTTRTEGPATNTRTEGPSTSTRTDGPSSSTRTEGGATNVRTQGEGITNVVSTETSTQNTSQSTAESGGDRQVENYSYEGA